MNYHLETPLVYDFPTLVRAGVGCVPGCYAASVDGECLYVGRSSKLIIRIFQHFVDQRDGSGVRWRLSGETSPGFYRPFAPDGTVLQVWFSDDSVSLERELILELNPSFNIVDHRGGKRGLRDVFWLDHGRTCGGRAINEVYGRSCWLARLATSNDYFVVGKSKCFDSWNQCRQRDECAT